MNNTEELIAVAWEFGMADYIGPVYFKLLQEIVDLRKEVNNLYEENESLLHERAGDNW